VEQAQVQQLAQRLLVLRSALQQQLLPQLQLLPRLPLTTTAIRHLHRPLPNKSWIASTAPPCGAFFFDFFMRACKFIFVCLLSVPLVGCQGLNASVDTLGVVFSSVVNSDRATYMPGFEYIEVELAGKKTALALGYRKVSGSDIEEYWYSGAGEMLALRNGRLIESMGMTHEVRQTSLDVPRWEQLGANPLPLTWMRTRNLHPGYRYGVKEYVTSEAQFSKQGDWGARQTWIHESVIGQLMDGREWRYQERFQLEYGRVVFSEQCISEKICFKLKPLGVVVTQ
jgi:Group 4 capsule polysaccharide lipoprotein gfcB, YjbF